MSQIPFKASDRSIFIRADRTTVSYYLCSNWHVLFWAASVSLAISLRSASRDLNCAAHYMSTHLESHICSPIRALPQEWNHMRCSSHTRLCDSRWDRPLSSSRVLFCVLFKSSAFRILTLAQASTLPFAAAKFLFNSSRAIRLCIFSWSKGDRESQGLVNSSRNALKEGSVLKPPLL